MALLDDFNRADQNPPSSSWTDLTGVGEDPGFGLAIVSNACARDAGAGFIRGAGYWNVQDFGPNCEVFATLTNSLADSVDFFLRLVNIGVGTTDGYTLQFDSSATPDAWTIQRYDNGTVTPLGAVVSQDAALGDQILFRAIGNTLEGYQNGTLVISRSDATYSAAGKIGLAFATNDQAPRVDDFGGGTVPAPTIVLKQQFLDYDYARI